MNVKRLKEMLNNYPDEMDIILCDLTLVDDKEIDCCFEIVNIEKETIINEDESESEVVLIKFA